MFGTGVSLRGSDQLWNRESRIMAENHFIELVRSSIEYMDRQNSICEERFHLGKFHRIDYEQETGKMIFSDPGVLPKVISDFQVVGTLSSRSNTWLWAWDNPYLLENITIAVHEVRTFGEEKGLKKLVEPKWEATGNDAWEMTAIAAKLLQAEGVYNFPSDGIMVYVVLHSIKWIGPEKDDEPTLTGYVE
jgi:hypothetical protein